MSEGQGEQREQTMSEGEREEGAKTLSEIRVGEEDRSTSEGQGDGNEKNMSEGHGNEGARAVSGGQHEADGDTGPRPAELFKLIVDGEWEKAHLLCKKYPDEAQKWIGKKDNNAEVVWRRLPIHEACMRGAPIDTINTLLKAYPSGAEQIDHNGRLPIHHACAHGATTEVVERLATAYPQSVEMKDVWDKTPLNVAQGSSAENISEIVLAMEKNPFHWYCKNQEQKWRKESTARIAVFEKAFEAERVAYAEKIKKQQEKMDANKEAHKREIERILDEAAAQRKIYEEKMKQQQDEMEVERNAYEDHILRSKNEVNALKDLTDQKIEAMREKAEHEKGSLKASIENLEKNISESNKNCTDLEIQVEECNVKLAEQEYLNATLKTKIYSANIKAQSLEEQLRDRNESDRAVTSSIQSLNDQVLNLKAKLDETFERMETKDQEIGRLRATIESDEETQRVAAKIKDELESEIKRLHSELSKSKAETDERAKEHDSWAEEKRILKEKVAFVSEELSSIKATKDELEKQVLADASHISEMGKSSSEFYLQTKGRIDELERELEVSSRVNDGVRTEFEEEKNKLKAKIDSLEVTIVTLVNKRAQEQEKIIGSYKELEMGLLADSARHEAIMEVVAKAKTTFDVSNEITVFGHFGGD